MTVATVSRLDELEAVIDGGLQTFVEVGTALMEIRDSRLYMESHATFEDYCRERWHFSRQRAHQLITAGQVAGLMSTVVDTPLNEKQARELAPLRHDPEALAAAWDRAKEIASDTVTAADVRAAVRNEEAMPTESELWPALRGVIDALAAFAANDAAQIAATVPERRRAATARRLRDMGKYLGRIAWLLEGSEAPK